MGDKSRRLSKFGRLFGIGEEQPEPEPIPPVLSRLVTPINHQLNPLSPSLVLLADTKPFNGDGMLTRPQGPLPVVSRQPLVKAAVQRSALAKAVPVEAPRFRMLEGGGHEHHLRAAKRQEKLGNMLKDLLGAKKLRNEAKLAVPFDVNLAVTPNNDSGFDIAEVKPADKPLDGKQTGDQTPQKPPTLMSGLVNYLKANPAQMTPQVTPDTLQRVNLPMLPNDSRLFAEKYGRCLEIVGRGLFGIVRVAQKDLEIFAVKEFKRRANEPQEKYQKRLTTEFSIMASLKHLNIIKTLDLLRDAKGDYCEVMEFCAGGDLYLLIVTAGRLEYAEADCFFKQLIRGVNYIHDMGVAHRDLKPENLILTQQGVLKITDFGNSECFKMAWEDDMQMSEGVCGLLPYIAPEEFTAKAFDPRAVDIWACGVIYMAMRTGRQLWKLADPDADAFYAEYMHARKREGGYEPIELLKRARCRNVIYLILDPKPDRRITGPQILQLEWGHEIKVCAAGEGH